MARQPLTAKSSGLFRTQIDAALDYVEGLIGGIVGVTDGDKGDITVSGSGTAWNIDANAVGTTEIADGAVTFGKLAGAAVITSGEGLRSNDTDTSLPTSAAVIDAIGPQLQTEVSASSQTEIDFTGVPSWANRVTVLFAGLSTNGTSAVLVQIGDSGGIENTGYTAVNLSTAGGALAHGTSTAGFLIGPQAATDTFSGAVIISKVSGNLWVANGQVKRNSSAFGFVSGDKTLSSTLDRVRITAANGTDTFDAGSVNISWE